jgi:hypothetical protein
MRAWTSMPQMRRRRCGDRLAQLCAMRRSKLAGPLEGGGAYLGRTSCKGELAMAMLTIETRSAPAIDAGVWRDLAQLAVEALVIGVVFSVLLALAVFVVARGTPGDEFAGPQSPPVELRADATVA